MSDGSMIANTADPNGPYVTIGALEPARPQRRERLRGVQRAPTKKQVTLRLDPEVIDKFRATGRGWQARINDTLRAAKV